MRDSKWTICTNVLLWSWLALGALTAIWAHLALGSGSCPADTFDGSLFPLQSIYAAHGLKPYVDYGFLYPPGPALLFGRLLHLGEIRPLQVAVSTFNFILVMIVAALVAGSAKSDRRLLCGATLFCLGAVIPMACMWLAVDPCPLSLSSLALILVLKALRRHSFGVWIRLAAATALATLWRWDRVFPSMVILAFGAAILWMGSCTINHNRLPLRWMAKRLFWTALIGLVGAGVGLAFLAVYGLVAGNWTAERDFVFHIPVFILPYKSLPLPVPKGADMQWVTDIIALLLAAAIAIFHGRSVKRKGHATQRIAMCALFAAPLALLPYSLWRADAVHFLALTASMITVLIADATICRRESRYLLFLLICLVVYPLHSAVKAQARYQGVLPTANRFNADLKQSTSECSALLPRNSRSLFVGQGSYNSYVANYPIFYLAHPELRPATAFISDEPGVQSSCEYGSRIAGDLAHAPRPLIVVLDVSPFGHSWEPNLSAHLRNCRKIESELSSLPIGQLGTCTISGEIFKVEVVK